MLAVGIQPDALVGLTKVRTSGHVGGKTNRPVAVDESLFVAIGLMLTNDEMTLAAIVVLTLEVFPAVRVDPPVAGVGTYNPAAFNWRMFPA